MRLNEKAAAVSTAVMSVVAIILLVIGAAGGYYAGQGRPTGSVATVTSTVIQSASGGGGGATVTQTATQTVTQTGSGGGSPSNDLEAAAKAEGGNLQIYTTQSDTNTQIVIKQFMTDYPWAHVSSITLTSSDLYNRVVAENKAGKYNVDVISSNEGPIYTLLQNLTTPYLIPYLPLLGYTNDTYDPSGIWSPTMVNVIGVAYNTNLVSPADVPKTWADLANSKWNGKLTFDQPSRLTNGGTVFAFLYSVMGNATWTAFMKNIATSNPTIVSSASGAINNVVQGTSSISIGSSYADIAAAVRNGSPVKFDFLTPQMRINFVSTLAKNAPHPNTAKLFLQWQASNPGQATWGKIGVVSGIPVVNQANPNLGIPGNLTYFRDPSIYSNAARWTAVFKNIFGQ